jgi:hypothetical protein
MLKLPALQGVALRLGLDLQISKPIILEARVGEERTASTIS